MTHEVIYLGKSNTIDWQLCSDSIAVDLAPVTRMVVCINDINLDSVELSGNGDDNAFYWLSGAPSGENPNLYLRLGVAAKEAGLEEGCYPLRLTIYDPDHTAGNVWVDDVVVQVLASNCS